jgi:hypothetical protein
MGPNPTPLSSPQGWGEGGGLEMAPVVLDRRGPHLPFEWVSLGGRSHGVPVLAVGTGKGWVLRPISCNDTPDPTLHLAAAPEHEGAVEDIWESDHDDPTTLIQVRRLTRGMRHVLQEAGIAAD